MDFCKSVESLTITTAEQAVKANGIANKLLEIKKQAKADYDKLADPHQKALTELRQVFNPVIDAAGDYQKKIKLGVHDFKAQKQFEQDEKQIELNRAAETDLTIPEQAPVEIPYLAGRGSVTRKIWKVVITDQAAFLAHCLKEGFNHFLTIDENALNQYARNRKMVESFPGCEIKMQIV